MERRYAHQAGIRLLFPGYQRSFSGIILWPGIIKNGWAYHICNKKSSTSYGGACGSWTKVVVVRRSCRLLCEALRPFSAISALDFILNAEIAEYGAEAGRVRDFYGTTTLVHYHFR